MLKEAQIQYQGLFYYLHLLLFTVLVCLFHSCDYSLARRSSTFFYVCVLFEFFFFFICASQLLYTHVLSFYSSTLFEKNASLPIYTLNLILGEREKKSDSFFAGFISLFARVFINSKGTLYLSITKK